VNQAVEEDEEEKRRKYSEGGGKYSAVRADRQGRPAWGRSRGEGRVHTDVNKQQACRQFIGGGRRGCSTGNTMPASGG